MSISEPITISRQTARRFLLMHQNLACPRNLQGKPGILEYIRHVGCVQFDPIDIVGRNPDLVLQARIQDYRPGLLGELLYRDHLLMDAWDKVSSICMAQDWPYFARHRQRMVEQHFNPEVPLTQTALALLEQIRRDGAYGASTSAKGPSMNWSWGRPARVERAALDILYAAGYVGISGRIGSRRFFDLVERLFPPDVVSAADPNETLDQYHEWHVLRRIGGLGLVQASSSDYWLGIQYMKSPERAAALQRLVECEELVPVQVEELPQKTFYLRTADLDELHAASSDEFPTPEAVILPPLDNLLWDRKLLSAIFEFDYSWEIYKRPHERKYGHYTLPVLYGDRFVARFEPGYDKKLRSLSIRNWWWEAGVSVDSELKNALETCLVDFMGYLQAETIKGHETILNQKS